MHILLDGINKIMDSDEIKQQENVGDKLNVSKESFQLPVELSLDKLHDTIASYCFVANESRLKATHYQHQLQCERTRHSFAIELLEKQVKEANNNYDNERKLRLLIESELDSNRVILYQRNEYLTKQDKVIRFNEEGLDRANNRIQSLDEKIEELEKENRILKVSLQKEQIDHTLTTEKLNNEINENGQKTIQIEELNIFKSKAEEEITYLEDKVLHDHKNLLSLTNNYSTVTDRYEELCKHAKLVDRWIEDMLSYIGVTPEMYDNNEDQVELNLLEDREGGNNSIVSVSNSKTECNQKNMMMIRSIYRDAILRKELSIIFDRLVELTNDEIKFLFTKKKYHQLIAQDEISRYFNHFWIDFASNKDNQLQDIKMQNIQIIEDMNTLTIENKRLVNQLIENNTETLLSTLLKQTEQIKTLQKNNALKDKTIGRNKMLIEKLKVFETSYHNVKVENEEDKKLIAKLKSRMEELTSAIDNKDAARAEENQNSMIIQNLVLGLNSELQTFKNRLSYDAEKDFNPMLSQVEECLKGNNKLSTFEKTLISDSISNIATLWESVDHSISFRSNYNNVCSNIKDVSSELHETKSFSIRESRRMSILYEGKLEEIRNNDSANQKLKRENNDLVAAIAAKDKTIAMLSIEVNNNSNLLQNASSKFHAYLSSFISCTVIGFVLMFRIMTIYISTTYSIPQKDDKNKKNYIDDEEYKELSDQIVSMQKTMQRLIDENEKLHKEIATQKKFKEHFIDSLDKSQKGMKQFEQSASGADEKGSKPETPTKTYSSWKLQKHSFLGKRIDKLEKLSPSPTSDKRNDSPKREAKIMSIHVVKDSNINEFQPSTPSPSKKSIRLPILAKDETNDN